ncbi:unnamed protein product [Urochloa humidicola]
MSTSPASVPSGSHAQLPLIDCKNCAMKVISLRSRAGVCFYKCPNCIKGDPTSCDQYWFEEQYLQHLRRNFPHLVPPNFQSTRSVAPPLSSGVLQPQVHQPNTEFVNQISELKLANCDLKMELCQLKMQNGEVKGQLNELKQVFPILDELRNAVAEKQKVSAAVVPPPVENSKLACNNGVLAAVVILVVGVLLGMLVSGVANAK